jgi:DNA-binding NtrC family response regulator
MADKKGRILCVDDEPNISRALQWLLQKDFDVMTANSGSEGLSLVKQNDFDVVISDHRMPMMTGVELLREVKKLSPRTVRILLTGYSDLQAIVRSVNESEVYRFINKPWNISELPKVVEQAAIIARTQPAEVPEPELTEDMPIAASGESVLLIDDNPQMLAAIEDAVGDLVTVLYAANLAEAVALLDAQPVSVIISETKVGTIDATRLIRLMKQRHPEIVTVMLTGQSDADVVTRLINQGQIYRFVPKPVRSGYLKLIIHSALAKHRKLKETPSLTGRHLVESTSAGTLESLLADVRRVAQEVEATGGKAVANGLFGKIGTGFRRLFG